MSRKHHTKHPDRGRSHYPKRLEARGLSKAPQLQDLDYLRRKQEREAAEREAEGCPTSASEQVA